MLESSERVDEFKADIAAMKLKTGQASREGLFIIASVILMFGGIALALGAYAASLNVKVSPGSNLDVLDSNSYMQLAIAGLTISVVGGFLFLRFSLARFLRYWLLRQSYEQRVAIDEAARQRVEPARNSAPVA